MNILDRFDTRAFIAIVLTGSMVALTFVLALRIPESDAFKVLLGAMLTVGFSSAIGWYFNSSAGSEKKDVTIAEVAKMPANGAAALAIAAAEDAAPTAAKDAAPPAAKVAAPPAARKAVADALKNKPRRRK